MDNIKEYINKHRADFDVVEPDNGHFERFAAKTKPAQLIAFLAIAAMFTLFIAFSLIFLHIKNQNVSCENSSDMKACYIFQMESVASDIKTLTEKYDAFTRDNINMEVDMIVDMNRYFDEELPEELSTKAKKEILKNYYSDNLSSLQAIVIQLNTNL